MSPKVKIAILAVVAMLLIGIFLFWDVGRYWEFVLTRRGKGLLAILLTGSTIAFSTVVFQTITHNRILTPSIIGFDSLYMLIQTSVVFLFGANTLTLMNKNVHFLISIVVMVMFAGLLYKFIFQREGSNIYFLLLVGIILGTLFSNLSSFMEMLIDPNEFLVVQNSMFASFNNMNTDLLILSFILIGSVTVYFLKFTKYLDVLSLGKEHAVNLGVDYDYVVKRLLIIVAILVSVATALVGPITFLGLLVANVSYQFLNTYQHKYLISGSVLISIIALVGGQFIVERLLTFETTLSVIINFVGGVYFLYLLLKESKAWLK